MTVALRPGLGNWVDGERFFNRDKELALFIEHLLNGESISLVAQRRIGKTSLMREAARRIGGGATSIQVDLEKCQTPEDAVVALAMAIQPYDGLWKKTIQLFSGAAKGLVDKIEAIQLYELSVNLRSSLTDADWRQKGDAIFEAFADMAKKDGKSVVVFLDEVPILVSRLLKGADGIITPERRMQTDLFMSWLRDNALRHQRHVAIVVTGSVGLEPLLNQAGLNGTLNAYRSFELKAWNAATAINCILALAESKSIDIPHDVASEMVALLGSAIPHHVQMFFDHVRTNHVLSGEEGAVTKEQVRAIYDESLTGLRGHPELSHMEERLRLVLAPEHFSIALEVLTEAAVLKSVHPETAIGICAARAADTDPTRAMNDILAILEHDGYLTREGDVYVFSSFVIRDWWAKRFGQGYKPFGGRT